MSGVPADAVPPTPPTVAAAERAPSVRLPRAVCPFLEVVSGRWRHAGPSRDHRCTALHPAAPLTTDKQRRLCLGAAHVTCPAFLAARAARASWPVTPGQGDGPRSAGDGPHDGAAAFVSSGAPSANRWQVLRVAPVVAAPEVGPGVGDVLRHWAAGRVGLVGLLFIAFVAILLSRPSADRAPGALLVPTPTSSPSPTIIESASATSSSTPAALSTSAPATQDSFAVTAAPATPSPEATPQALIYTVVSGDTLSAIAGRYATTVQAIMALNGLESTNLRIGQQLAIPQAPTPLPSLGPAP